MHLTGRVVVITGASSGIGAALAEAIARRGGRVVLAARRRERLEALACRLRAAGAEADAVPCNVTRPEDVATLFRLARRFGEIDILVNNAGVSLYGASVRARPADLEALLRVNVWGPWYAMQEVIPYMRRRGSGLIVNVSSVAALHGPPYLALYAGTKAALTAITEGLRAELSADGIRFLTVYPGYTATEIFSRERRLGGARRPRGPYASPHRVARAVVRAIERERRELVLSTEGRLLAASQRWLPGLLEFAMRHMADVLQEPTEEHHVQTQAADHRPLPESG